MFTGLMMGQDRTFFGILCSLLLLGGHFPLTAAVDRAALLEQAKSNDAEAQYQLAEAFYWARGGPHNHESAAKYARQSAKQGNAKAQYRLALMIIRGDGLKPEEQDWAEAIDLLERAGNGLIKLAEQGDVDARFKLALLAGNGLLVGEVKETPYPINPKRADELIQQAATGGIPEAQIRVGLNYLHPRGDAQASDYPKAVEWIQKAVAQGFMPGAFELWVIHKATQGKAVELKVAVQNLRLAAEKGFAPAQLEYGMALAGGRFGLEDPKTGYQWVKQAAEQGHPIAMQFYAAALSRGIGVEKNVEEAFYWLHAASSMDSVNANLAKDLAVAKKVVDGQLTAIQRLDVLARPEFQPKPSEQYTNIKLGLIGVSPALIRDVRIRLFERLATTGNAAAAYGAARLLEQSKDMPAALIWFRKAAEKKHIRASHIMGGICASGRHVERDFNQAALYFKQAAEQGHRFSQFELGHLILLNEINGFGKMDGVQWLQKSAKQGLPHAQNSLGVVYANGDYVEQDFALARKWLKAAADQHYPRSQFYYGNLCRDGSGGEVDFKEALKWYRRAARQGVAHAAFEIGVRYYKGEGVEKSLPDAYYWMEIARLMKRDGVQGLMAQMAQDLTRQQIATAELNARRFRVQNLFAQSQWVEQGPKTNETEEPVGDVKALTAKAGQGDADAQFELAKLIAAGNGVETDAVEAYKWFQLAKRGGHPDAASEMKKLVRAQKMDLNMILKANKLAAQFKPTQP